jgi:endonuclease/exonuclease/phosphatase family metal-dependent hydrolase
MVSPDADRSAARALDSYGVAVALSPNRPTSERLSNVDRVERAARRVEWARLSLAAAGDDLDVAGEHLAARARELAETVETLARDLAARLPAVRP